MAARSHSEWTSARRRLRRKGRSVSRFRSEAMKELAALRRSRFPIIAIALTHVVTVTAGIIMVHTGNRFTLSYRDRLVAQAHASDPVAPSFQEGDRLRAALIETVRTQWACLATGLTGLSVIPPFLLSGYRGWVGGIISVDRDHISRLGDPPQAIYYLSVVILQLIPYSLAAGAGLNLGLTYFGPRADYLGGKWIGYPREAFWDFARIVVLTVPLVIVANLWEFLSPLNS